MVSLLNSTCARFDDVARSGARYELEPALLFVKGTWLPSEFSISICDGSDAWTGRAYEEYVVENANRLDLTESEYVDRVQFYFSQQQPNANYELKWGKSLSPELICSLPQKQTVLSLQTTTDSGPRVAADMVQLLLDAHHGLTEELAKKTRWFEREIAAKERSLASLRTLHTQDCIVSPRDRTNGHVNEGEEPEAVKTGAGTSSRVKRKAGAGNADTGSRKRSAKASEPLPIFQKTRSPAPLLLEPAPTTRPPPLSALGYKQQSRSEARRETSKDPSWLVAPGHPNGMADDSLSEGQALDGKKAFLDRLLDVVEPKTDPVPAKKSSSKRKHSKSGGKRSSKKEQPQHSLENSLDQVEDVVEKGINCVDNIAPSREALEVTSRLSPRKTPGKALVTKPERKTPASAKKRASSPKVEKEKKPTSSRSSRKRSTTTEPRDPPPSSPEIVPEPLPAAVDEDREIDVVNAEFSDFDASRSEGCFEENQFWALYDDQDGMPRFYGHVTRVQNAPFEVSVKWLEPSKPNCPASGLVKTAGLSPSCGEFTFGSNGLQDLPAFSHLVEVERDTKGSMITFWPAKNEIWALYRHWEKKQTKADGDQSFHYEYDLVLVASDYSIADGLAVAPVIKVEGFKSLFKVASEDKKFYIPQRHVQARFSHCIPQRKMTGSESPGVPPGAWELDPASTPAEYLGTGGLDGNA